MVSLVEGSAPLTAADLLACLRREYDALSPKLATAADYLIARPDEIAFTSMRQMAERAGVQPAVMVRLAQRIGLDGYESLREPFRAALRRQPAGLAQRARDLQAWVQQRGGGRPLTRLASELFALERENLAATLDGLDDGLGGDRLAAASQTMARSRCLYIVGQRSLFSVASYLQQVTSMFRSQVVLLDGVGDAWADALRQIGRDDTLMAFSFDPYARGTICAAQFAQSRGAGVIAVTDRENAPLAEFAKIVLPIATVGPGLVPSVVSAMAIAQTLANQMLALGGQAALEMLAATEMQFDAFDTFWDESRDVERNADDERAEGS